MGFLSDIAPLAGAGIGALIGGAPGAAVGASAGAAFSSAQGAQATNQANADIAAANNAWSADQYGSRYQTMVKDMQAAGLNPMLAYSQSPGSSPSAQPVTYQNPYAGYPQAAASAASAYQSVKGVDASSQRDLASAAQSEAEIRRVNASADKIISEIENIPVERERLLATARMLNQQAELIIEQTHNTSQVTKNLMATIEQIHATTKLLNLDISAAQTFNNLGREFSQLKPIFDLMGRVLLRR